MLRNLNQSFAHGRIAGTTKTGVKGSLIPSTGLNGPAYLYNKIVLPGDNNVEVQGYITSIPAGLALSSYEDSSFTVSGPQGSYTVPFKYYRDGVFQSNESFQVTIGSLIITTTTGGASATGITANIITPNNPPVVITTTTGNASAIGITALVIVNPPPPPPPPETTPGTYSIQNGIDYVEELGLWVYRYTTVEGFFEVYFTASQTPKIGDSIVEGVLVPRTTYSIVGRPDWYNPRWE